MSEPLLKYFPGKTALSESHLTKREFLKICGASVCVFSAANLFVFPKTSQAQLAKKGLIKTKVSPYFTPLSGGEIQCDLCPRRCRVSQGEEGGVQGPREPGWEICTAWFTGILALFIWILLRRNPSFMSFLSTTSFSLATVGCNFQCKFCQNWEISQASPEDVYSYDIPPETIVTNAKEVGAHSVAYTYVEPTIFYEYMVDICQLVKKAGLLNVCHSNGFINPEPLKNLCKVMDAANIDLKGFTETFYRDVCSGELTPVLETLKTLKKERVHWRSPTSLSLPRMMICRG